MQAFGFGCTAGMGWSRDAQRWVPLCSQKLKGGVPGSILVVGAVSYPSKFASLTVNDGKGNKQCTKHTILLTLLSDCTYQFFYFLSYVYTCFYLLIISAIIMMFKNDIFMRKVSNILVQMSFS